MTSLLPQTPLRLHEIRTLETTRPTNTSPLHVIAYTDVAAIGGAELSLSHLVATVSDNIDVTVVGISEHVVTAIASGRPQAARVVILGEGSQHEALDHRAAELGVSDRVELRGWVDNPREYLPEFDVIAMPSRSEGFPLAIVEAMLAARPVVATRVGSVAEAVLDGETGFLIDKDDFVRLATVLHRLRDNPELRICLGHRGREVAVSRFTVEHMAKNYERLWHEVVTAPPTPRLRVPRPRD